MKKIFSLIFPLFSLSVITCAQTPNSYPVFVLNDTFSHSQPKDSKITPQKYQLTFLKGFKLDCSKYDFTLIRTMNEGKDPDAIFIVSESGNYLIELNSAGETIIDASTMHSLDNPKKEFKKFEKGDTPILGIGTLKIKDGKAQMLTYWVSMIEVK